VNIDKRDLLAAFSLANLAFIKLWDGLINYTPSQAFFLEHAPPRAEYAAAFANVFLVGLVFYACIRFARWIASRFETLGMIFGSLPILTLIALPAAKSIVRLLANRLPDADLSLMLGAFAVLAVVVIASTRRRFFNFASAVLVTISPLILIEAVLSLSRCWTDQSAAFADGPLAPRTPEASRPRVVWMIFDELDYRLAFEDRPANVPMGAFDRLRTGSLFAENAVSPAQDTSLSVPSLITGETIENLDTKSPRVALLNGVSASARPTIFTKVHAMGANAAVVGWYLPYCRLFSQDLTFCSYHDLENELGETSGTFWQSLFLEQQSLVAYGFRSLLGESPRAKHHLSMMDSMHADAVRVAADPSFDLVFLHLPVPHAPYLYDRFTYTFPKHYLSYGSYFDNLALADIYLTDIREAMVKAGVWDSSTVIVSSDHPDRLSMAVDGKEDPRVPFLLKMPGQTTGSTYEQMIPTLLTKALVEAVLNREVTTPEEAVKWLTAHPK
jgi:hypothetical protein